MKRSGPVHDTFWNGIYPLIDYSTGGSIDGMIAAADANLAATTDDTMISRVTGEPWGPTPSSRNFGDMLVAVRDVGCAEEAGPFAR